MKAFSRIYVYSFFDIDFLSSDTDLIAQGLGLREHESNMGNSVKLGAGCI